MSWVLAMDGVRAERSLLWGLVGADISVTLRPREGHALSIRTLGSEKQTER